MFENLIRDIVTDEFMARVGKNEPGRAFKIEFKTRIDYDSEEGYRYLELLVWAPTNYVAVLARRRWNVIARAAMEWNAGEGEDLPKKGTGYSDGESDWVLLSHHDSGWRGGVDRFFRDHGGEIVTFAGLGRWAEVVDLSGEEVERLGVIVNEGKHWTGRLPAGAPASP